MKKAISALLALFLILGLCAGCGNSDKTPDSSGEPDQNPQTDVNDGSDSSSQDVPPREGQIYNTLLGIDPGEAALEADGNAIPAELYLYWLTAICSEMEYNLNMYNSYYSGMYGNLLNEDGTAKWDEIWDGTPLSQAAREQTESNALSYLVVENVAAAHNIALTGEDKSALESDKAAYIEQIGGQEAFENNLWEMGVSEESFDRVSAVAYLYQHLAELAQDPGSDLYEAPTNTDAYVDHILLMTKDSETNEPLSDEEAAAKLDKANELLAQLQAADPEELEELFTRLADENGEDPGRTEAVGYLINENTNFVPEFKEAAFALKPGEISGIVESDYGYHILLRKDLTEDQLSEVAANHLANYLDGQLEAVLEKVVRSEKLESIDVGAFYNSYREAIQARHPELNDDAGTGDGGDATSVTPGSTGGTAE